MSVQRSLANEMLDDEGPPTPGASGADPAAVRRLGAGSGDRRHDSDARRAGADAAKPGRGSGRGRGRGGGRGRGSAGRGARPSRGTAAAPDAAAFDGAGDALAVAAAELDNGASTLLMSATVGRAVEAIRKRLRSSVPMPEDALPAVAKPAKKSKKNRA